jgi:hypothetical protein
LHRHFIFSTESVREIRGILDAYRAGAPLNTQVRRIGVAEARVYGEAEVSATKGAPPAAPRQGRADMPKRKEVPAVKRKAPPAEKSTPYKKKKTNGKKYR